jgi:hypothetical protein
MENDFSTCYFDLIHRFYPRPATVGSVARAPKKFPTDI